MRSYRLKTIMIITLSLLWLTPSQAYAWDGTEPLIVDHRAVQQFDQIPDYWIERAKEMTVHYGHTSHGSQIVSGLKYLEKFIDPVKYKFRDTLTYNRDVTLPPQESPPALLMAREGSHPYDYWEGESTRSETIQILSLGDFDISGWSWCGEHGRTENVEAYLDSMQIIEAARPGVMFFYMTGASSPYVVSNNDLIREHCINNNKILFDFADIEQYDPDGVYQPGYDGRGEAWGEEWVRRNPDVYYNIPVTVDRGGNPDLALVCLHAHGLFAIMKGQAFWWMMARLAGWDGVSQDDPDPDDNLLGDVTGNGEISSYDASLAAQYSIGLVNLSYDAVLRADVTGNSEVSSYDASLIAQYTIGLIQGF